MGLRPFGTQGGPGGRVFSPRYVIGRVLGRYEGFGFSRLLCLLGLVAGIYVAGQGGGDDCGYGRRQGWARAGFVTCIVF